MTDDLLPTHADEGAIQVCRARLAQIASDTASAAVESALFALERRNQGVHATPDDPPVCRFCKTLGELDRAWWDLARAMLDGGNEADRIIHREATDSSGELVADTLTRMLLELREERRDQAWALVTAGPITQETPDCPPTA